MRVPHLRVLAGTGVMAATLAMAIGLASTTANAAQGPAGGSTAAAAKKAASDVTSNVTGTFKNSDGTGTFAGTFTPKKFSVVNGTLEATGTLTNADGSTVGTVGQTATMPVNTAAAAADPAGCGILNLVLGPLNLNLLGLVVTLNQVHLNITAVPGVGNLLGNLLCAVANLLNGTGSLSEISTLLNEILA